MATHSDLFPLGEEVMAVYKAMSALPKGKNNDNLSTYSLLLTSKIDEQSGSSSDTTNSSDTGISLDYYND